MVQLKGTKRELPSMVDMAFEQHSVEHEEKIIIIRTDWNASPYRTPE